MADANPSPDPPIGAAAFAATEFAKAMAQGDTAEAWWQRLGLSVSAQGLPHANAANVGRVLRGHPRYAGHVWFDTFHARMRTDLGDQGARMWADSDDIAIMDWLQGELKIPRISLAAVQQAALLVATQSPRREPCQWLWAQKWDGFHRLDGLATLGFGAVDSDYSLAVGANLVKSLVARLLEPGAKVDNMVVLEGGQGIGKTRALQILGGAWYGELHSAFGTKDAIQELPGKALLEIAELEAMSKRQVEAIKAWLSRCVDTYRPSYGRHAVDVPRSCIFVGSTNESAYLRDSTGARRFWPLRCGQINLAWLKDNRDQLFAEARVRVADQGEGWWDVPADEAAREQEQRYEGDPWAEPIDRWLTLKDRATVSEVLSEAVKLEVPRQDKRAQMRVAAILHRLGWVRHMEGIARHRVWRRAAPEGGSGGSQVVRLRPIANQEGEQREQPF